MCLVLITWLSIISTNMKILYVVQMDMAEEGYAQDWANIRACKTQEAAVKHVEWMRKEYGEDIPFQITMLEYYKE